MRRRSGPRGQGHRLKTIWRIDQAGVMKVNQSIRIVIGTLVTMLWATGALPHHPDDACPDTHINGGESISYEITVNETGQPVTNGMVLPQYTNIKVHALGTAYGRCEMYYDFGQCYAGAVQQRSIYFLALYEATNWFPSERRSMAASTVSQYPNVIDTHDTSATTGPMGTSMGIAGPYWWEIRNVINTTNCLIDPSSVSRFVKVYSRSAANDENLGCQSSSGTTVGNPCNVATGNKYQKELDSDDSTLPITRHYNSKLTEVDFGIGQGWLTKY
jgi:hypothetical protein